MNDTPTPRTDEWGTISKEDGHWSSHQRRERWIKAVPSKVSAELETKLAAVTEQRDRLEEAFQDMLNDTLTPTNDEWIVTDNENYIEIASIKTCDSIASVHGGKTIGDQYDLAGRIARVPQLERELIAAREEIKELNDKLDDAVADATNAVNDIIRMKWQRDRLAEECAKIRDVAERAIDYLDQSYRDGFSDEVSELRYELAAVNAEVRHGAKDADTN